MLISENMYLFLKDYMNWVNNGAVNKKPYYRATGLCFNLELYTRFNDDSLRANLLLELELESLFEAEGLNRYFPFEEDNYDTRVENKTQHEDPIRLEWINAHIKEYENSLVTA